jgi:formate hydrogenlyase transcriptional activator
MLLSEGDTIKHIQLPRQKNATAVAAEKKEFLIRKIEENEKEYILNMLQYCKRRVCGYQGAAEQMGIPSSTLFSKMKKLGIKRSF